MDQAVRSYFDAVPETRQPHVMALHEAIIECFPDVNIDMRYRMPTYSYGEGWTGKGCINFREKDEIPVADVKAVIRHALLIPKGT